MVNDLPFYLFILLRVSNVELPIWLQRICPGQMGEVLGQLHVVILVVEKLAWPCGTV